MCDSKKLIPQFQQLNTIPRKFSKTSSILFLEINFYFIDLLCHDNCISGNLLRYKVSLEAGCTREHLKIQKWRQHFLVWFAPQSEKSLIFNINTSKPITRNSNRCSVIPLEMIQSLENLKRRTNHSCFFSVALQTISWERFIESHTLAAHKYIVEIFRQELIFFFLTS